MVQREGRRCNNGNVHVFNTVEYTSVRYFAHLLNHILTILIIYLFVLGVNCLGRCNKGPNAKILTKSGAFIEASTIRSVENVVDLLQLHLGLNVNVTSAEVLRLNYEGNTL